MGLLGGGEGVGGADKLVYTRKKKKRVRVLKHSVL